LPVLAFVAAGCDLPGQPNPANRPVPANQVKDFKTLYARHCSGCHGADGQLGPAPPLNDPLFLAIVPDAELLRVIAEGRAVNRKQKTPMPAFAQEKGGPLTAAQVKVLAEGLKQHWGSTASFANSVPPYWAPTGSAGGTQERGTRVFARACAGCHGSQGQGSKDGDRQIGAINDLAFLTLISDQALRRYIITGRPDLGMPGYNGKDGRSPDFQALTSAEIEDLVALLAYWRLGGSATRK
jgi:mono/diheme cytochrome c family protein